MTVPGLGVIKLESILRLKMKRNDWLLADTCPQAANHCAFFSRRLYSRVITSRPGLGPMQENNSLELAKTMLCALTGQFAHQ